mmetsp:Transcript_117827/g.345178  ORF Transcript_117827/g.345178 Transcript_117827/m.345178 type:complete len:212 (+) Transcript_117827:1779-2414(+)
MEFHQIAALLLQPAAHEAPSAVQLGGALRGGDVRDLYTVALAEVRGPTAKGEERFQLNLLLHDALVLVAEVVHHADDPPQVNAIAVEDPLQELVQLLKLGSLEVLLGLAGAAELVELGLRRRCPQPDQRLREHGRKLVLVGDLPQVLGLQMLELFGRQKHQVAALVLHEILHKGLLPVQLLPSLRFKPKDLDALVLLDTQRPADAEGQGPI